MFSFCKTLLTAVICLGPSPAIGLAETRRRPLGNERARSCRASWPIAGKGFPRALSCQPSL